MTTQKLSQKARTQMVLRALLAPIFMAIALVLMLGVKRGEAHPAA